MTFYQLISRPSSFLKFLKFYFGVIIFILSLSQKCILYPNIGLRINDLIQTIKQTYQEKEFNKISTHFLHLSERIFSRTGEKHLLHEVTDFPSLISLLHVFHFYLIYYSKLELVPMKDVKIERLTLIPFISKQFKELIF